MSDTVPNPPLEREAADVRHSAEVGDVFTRCGLRLPGHRWTDDYPNTPVDCPACLAKLHPQPMPAVDSWAAATDAELEERLRDSAAKQLAGLDAATPNAEDLAEMVARSGIHYDPGTLERLTLCDLNVPELLPWDVTTHPPLATCPTCTAALVDSKLPPEPVETLQDQLDQLDAERASYHGLDGTEPEHRTVGLEVLTDELRQLFDIWGARGHLIGIVCRRNGEAVDVPEVQTLWEAPFRKPADVLSILLRQARMYADGLDGEAGAELLMPGPEVLAALAGEPVGSYTRSVPSSYGVVEPGWFVLVETVVQGVGDFQWLLVEDRRECDIWRDCPVAGGEPHICHVVYVRGRGVQHIQSWMPVKARIPASTEVEL